MVKVMKELEEILHEGKKKLKENTVNYVGSPFDYCENKFKAATGFIGSILVSPVSPFLGFLLVSYGGVKGYQAYKDWRAKNGR